MNSLFAVALALTAILAAVEAKGQTKKRGLEEYTQQLSLGGPFDLGSIHGLELQGLLTSGGLNLVSAGLQDYSLSLGNIGHYTVESAALLGGGGLYGSGLALSSGYANGYGLSSSPVSVPQPVLPAPALQQFRFRPLTREESAAASPSRIFGATRPSIGAQSFPPLSQGPPAPPPPPIPPTAFPPTNVPIPIATHPPAPLTAPGPSLRAGSVQLQAALPTPAPLPAPQPAPQPAQGSQVRGGRLGSGSLGYTDLGNGVLAFGSGSLGYTHSEPVNIQQAPQLNSLPQPVQIGQQQGLTYGNIQNLPLTQAYGGLQQGLTSSQQPQSPVYTSIQGAGLNQQYAGLQQGIYGTQQLSFSGQQEGSDADYGGYSLSGNRASTLQGVGLNSGLSGLNFNYGGHVNLLASLANGF